MNVFDVFFRVSFSGTRRWLAFVTLAVGVIFTLIARGGL